MVFLLNIIKKNKQYYISMINVDDNKGLQIRPVNAANLSECDNIAFQQFLSCKQEPMEYLRGDFDISKLIVNESSLKEKVNDFQIVSVYEENGKPCLYLSVDRMGNLSLHDSSELEYAKNSIYGNSFRSLPTFVKHEPVTCAYEYLKRLDEEKIKDMPVGLFKQYLLYVKGFQIGYHTVIEVNNGIALFVCEHLLFNGSATIKLIEYIPKNKKVYLTKQDSISNPYPMERTVDFLTSSINLVASSSLLSKSLLNEKIALRFYDTKSLFISLPLSSYGLKRMKNFDKSKNMYEGWHFDCKDNLPKEIYEHILPNEIFKLPNRFYSEMKNKPFHYNFSFNLAKENEFIDMFIYTVSFYFFWNSYSRSFQRKLRFIMKGFKKMYETALINLLNSLGPRDTLYVMKWVEEHLNQVLRNIKGLIPSKGELPSNGDIDLFTFFQNAYDLPETLKVYSTETIDQYGWENLQKSFLNLSSEKQRILINSLENIEKNIQKAKKDLLEQKRLLNNKEIQKEE